MGMITVKTGEKVQIADITDKVRSSIRIREGCLVLFVQHTTAGIIVNEDEDNLRSDLARFFGNLAKGEWAHDRMDDNASAHLAASAIGNSMTIPVSGGDLALGTWQSILFVELDGPRERHVHITELGQ